jgi:hypothetical protein
VVGVQHAKGASGEAKKMIIEWQRSLKIVVNKIKGHLRAPFANPP